MIISKFIYGNQLLQNFFSSKHILYIFFFLSTQFKKKRKKKWETEEAKCIVDLNQYDIAYLTTINYHILHLLYDNAYLDPIHIVANTKPKYNIVSTYFTANHIALSLKKKGLTVDPIHIVVYNMIIVVKICLVRRKDLKL